MIALKDYARNKDKYCLCYFGYSDEYLVQLRLIKPHLDRAFPGIQFHIGCRDEKTDLLKNTQSMTVSQIKVARKDFGHIREIKYNGETHPIEDLLVEANVINCPVNENSDIKNQKAVIITKGNHPTKPMLERQIKHAKKLIRNVYKMNPEVDTDVENAGLVLGVESVGLFEAASNGVKSILVPNGCGARLYKMMFPNGEVMHI